MPSHRPTAFIGSSAEGLPVAEAIQQNLDHTCETQIWHQGIFGLSTGNLEALVNSLDNYDFAILVLTPDDMSFSRGEEQQSPRDNVLLELGMFIGAIGRERTYVFYDLKADIKIPSDLAGITHAGYEPPGKANLQAALGAASTQIKTAMDKLGPRTPQTVSANIDETATFQIIHDLLDPSAEQFLIWMHENKRSLKRSGIVGWGIKYIYGFKEGGAGQGHFSIGDLAKKVPDAGLLAADLRDNISLTERGGTFADWLKSQNHKADYFESDVGSWGDKQKDMPDFKKFFQQKPPSA
jgi:hypothetical protein